MKIVASLRGRLLCAVVIPLCLTGVARAQPSSATGPEHEATELEVIVVNAQRRQEVSQSVPVSVSTVSPAVMEANAIETTSDLARIVPGLQFNSSAGASVIYLRGVGHNAAALGDEAAVAVFVDGVYMPTNYANVQAINKVAQVEVLRGPQGTLFGRNASGGVIHVITADPSHTSSLEASAGYGNYSTIQGQLYATTGVTPELATDISLYGLNQRDGWGVAANGRDVYRQRNYAFRNKWLWTPDEDTTVTLNLAGEKMQNNFAGTMIFPGAIATGGLTNQGFFKPLGNIYPSNETKRGMAALKVERAFPWFNVTNILAYQSLDVVGQVDQDALPQPFVNVAFSGTENTTTEELQISSLKGSRITWIVGLFYMKDLADMTNSLSGSLILPAAARGISLTVGQLETTSYAAFGQATVPLGADTNLTVGLRHTTDKRDLVGTAITGAGTTVIPQDAKYKKLTYRVSLDHEFAPNIMGYISANRGFKSGTYNLLGPTALGVGPEVVDAYEIGVKSELLERRLRLNASAFVYDYRGLQLRVLRSGSGFLANAGSASIKGVDVEMVGRVSPALTLTAAVEVLDPQFTSFPDSTISTQAPGGGNILTSGSVSGNDILQAPRFSGSIGLNYSHLLQRGTLDFSISAKHSSKYYWDPDNRITQPSTTLVNASIKYTTEDERWSAQLWGANLLDERYFSLANGVGNFGAIGTPAAPLTFGVTLTAHLR